jgi:hypothetical protein
MCSFTSDFDRGRAGYSLDRLDSLVWAVTELMIEPVAGWGLIEYTRLEAEKVMADQIGHRKAAEPPSLASGAVQMKNCIGVSTAYGLSGTQYNADAEGIFIVRAVDVGPLLAAGWTKNNLEVSL